MLDVSDMSIQTARLDSDEQTLIIASKQRRLPEIIYWGQRVSSDLNLVDAVSFQARSVNHAMMDKLADLSMCPEAGFAFPGAPGIQLHDSDGKRWASQFQLCDPVIELSSFEVAFCAFDTSSELRLSIHISLDQKSGVLQCKSSLANEGSSNVVLNWLSCPVFPGPTDSLRMLGFKGRWCQEFQIQEILWRDGQHVRENRLGRTSHEHFPGLIVPTNSATEHCGAVYGFHLGWSGNHRMLAEQLPDGRRQIQFGALIEPGECELKPGDTYSTPTLYAVFSAEGMNGLSQKMQGFCRSKIIKSPPWAADRLVHFNCWEAVYFDHNLDQLKVIAERASALGAEIFVLDDGWFKGRKNDTAGLGDWLPDPEKYPDGLEPLINHVKSEGMKFGIWLEPEMVSKNSELFRSYPDWILNVENLEQITGRHQYVLDLSQADVRNHLFQMITDLLKNNDISYVKWDMNRTQSLAARSNGRPVGAAQVKGLYQLLDDLNAAFPNVMFESCASGGGRIDFEILKRCSRVWLSDSNDAHERAKAQKNASYFFPAEIIGSHVGPSQCHTSGRRHTLSFRTNIAASRHMGLELDPHDLTNSEASELEQAIANYKSWRSLLASSLHYRIESDDPNTIAECFVSENASQFLLFIFQTQMQRAATVSPIKVPGLDLEKIYDVELVNANEIAAAVNFKSRSPFKTAEIHRLQGTLLSEVGFSLPNSLPDSTWILRGVEIHDLDC